jgi:hypothetical protein
MDDVILIEPQNREEQLIGNVLDDVTFISNRLCVQDALIMEA